jgi:uncharacterized protein (TIGR03067 family)
MLRRLVFLALPITVLLFGARPIIADDKDDSKSQEELKKLEGNWKLTRSEYKGNLRPALPATVKQGLFFEGGVVQWTDTSGWKGTITKINPTAQPMEIDLEMTRGQFISKKLLGIYEIKDDKLTICWSDFDEEKRPKKFVTKLSVGSGIRLETYERVKEKDAPTASKTDPKTDKTDSKGGNKDEAMKDALKKLEGNWRLSRSEHKGNLRPAAGSAKDGLFIEGEKIVWTRDGKEFSNSGRIIDIDPTAKPPTIDVEMTKGSYIGKKLLGIYEIDGKTLNICWGDYDGEKRPKKFVTKISVGSGVTFETFHRLKD